MIFYDCSTAPNPRRARMFIAEKGLSPEVRDISIAKSEQLSDDFLAVNPMATLPVLITDEGETLTENVGIATYLEAAFPEPALMGKTALEKGQVARWSAIAEHQGGAPIADAFRNSNPHMAGRAIPGPRNHDQIAALAERGFQRVADFFNLLESRLASTPYLAGDDFTYADITGFVLVDFARVIKTRIPDSNVHTRAWFDRVKARPSAAL